MALMLAAACLALSGMYLFHFLADTNSAVEGLVAEAKTRQISEAVMELAINSRLAIARLALLSCGVFVGMSFGFLGFALFLIGIKGEMDVQGKTEQVSVKIARMSPGVFVLFVASILIGICVTHSTSFEFSHTRAPDTPATNTGKKENTPSGNAADLLKDRQRP
jgi:hypothetical protein